MTPLSIGKLRGLQQCATRRGALAILALDHRSNLRRSMRPDDPTSVSSADLSAFKREVVNGLAPAASAILLDPQVGAAQMIAAGVLPGQVGLVVAVEESGYSGPATARESRLLSGWSVEKIKRLGASATKLLVYYHPEAAPAPAIEALVRQVAMDCTTVDLPLMLEILSYSPDPASKKLPPAERRRVVIESARRLVGPGVDIFKAEFPLDIAAETDEREWAKACADLSAASSAPWVLLSASVDYETFLRQVTIACQNGASGVAVGRAVWKEAVELSGQARTDFLQGQAHDRMARITELCDALARPFTDFYAAASIEEDWYAGY